MVRRSSISITIIADTHGLENELSAPYSDLLIHAGDWTTQTRSCEPTRSFNRWLGELPHRHKVVTCGNHEWCLEDTANRKLITNARLLVNESLTLDGLKIWASPVIPLDGAAFGMSFEEDRARLYATIPDDIDVLITHGPPWGILDRTPGSCYHSGCKQLLAAVERVKPKIHAFGHIHGAFGMLDTAATLFINAALLGVDGGLENKPVVLKIPWKPR